MIQNLPSPKTKQKGKRKGRGMGSGKGGHTTGKGNKGQLSRSGYKQPRPWWEGGQMPLPRRLPKSRGFSRGYFDSKKQEFTIRLSRLADAYDARSGAVTIETLTDQGIIKPRKDKIVKVKVLFDEEIDKKLDLEGIALSEKAKKAIEKAGGSVK